MIVTLAALIWVFSCSAAGALPRNWHKPVAYVLIALGFPLFVMLRDVHGQGIAWGFVAVAIFQLRLLLIHWFKRGIARLKTRG